MRRGHDEMLVDVEHRPVQRQEQTAGAYPIRNDVDTVLTQFQHQVVWHDELRKVQWKDLPPERTPPLVHGVFSRPVFIIVHLFSGRRREFDVHWHLVQMAAARGLDVAVLSMDTAVSSFYGDLASHSTSWRQLEKLYDQGLVAATICGSPCETFSAARHAPPPEDLPDDVKKRWPRPLRTFERLFGLDGLRAKELRQCRQGSAFMLQAVMVCIWHLNRGGLFLSEHPAPPTDQSKASIWTSAIIRLLLEHPDISLKIFNQWQWGAPVKKPTGLMSLRIPRLAGSMYHCADASATFPTEVAIGKDEHGQF